MATQIVKYYQKYPDGRLSLRKTQTQDDINGIPGGDIKPPYLLGYINWDGRLLTGYALLEKFSKPKWGPNKDKLLIDLIPDFPAKVSESIATEEWPWFEFDPENPETWPKTKYPPTSTNSTKGWECEGIYMGEYYQNMYWRGEETKKQWAVLGIYRYRRQKVENYDEPWIPNPEYPIVEAQRAEAATQLRAVLEENLVAVGTFKFQGLPLNGNGINYVWAIDGVKQEPDPNHKLAMELPTATSPTWKLIPAPMRNPELVTTQTDDGPVIKDFRKMVFDQKTYYYMWDLTKEEKLVYLTQ